MPADSRVALCDDQVADAARRLLAAERDRQPIRQLSLQYPEMTIEDAYRVQRALTAAKLAAGRTVKATRRRRACRWFGANRKTSPGKH